MNWVLVSLVMIFLKNSATERPHTSVLNNEYRKGIYVEKITGEPLFSSKHKI